MAGLKQKPIDFAFKMLAIRDYGEAELRAKMEAKGYALADLDPAIGALKQKNFLNDRVYIGKIIEKYHFRSLLGKFFKKFFLKKKGIKRKYWGAFLDKKKKRPPKNLFFKKNS